MLFCEIGSVKMYRLSCPVKKNSTTFKKGLCLLAGC